MPEIWFKRMKRDNPILAFWYHGLCKLNVAINLPCSENDVEAVVNGSGHDVQGAEKIAELYWSAMKTVMFEHESRASFKRPTMNNRDSEFMPLSFPVSNSANHPKL